MYLSDTKYVSDDTYIDDHPQSAVGINNPN